MEPVEQVQEFVRECVLMRRLLRDGRDLTDEEHRLLEASLQVLATEFAPRSHDISLETSEWSEQTSPQLDHDTN